MKPLAMGASLRRIWVSAAFLLAADLRAQPCFDGGGCCFIAEPDAPLNTDCPPPPAECFGVEGSCTGLLATWWDPILPVATQGIGAQLGMHLRWSFRLVSPGLDPRVPGGLGFPAGGFEVQRRVHGQTGGLWTRIGPRIYPATTLDDALARLTPLPPADVVDHSVDLDCDGTEDLDDLITLLEKAFCDDMGYDEFYWLEGSDRLWTRAEVEESVEFDAYHTHVHDFMNDHGRPPVQYKLKPLETMLLAAVDPVIARILGLYFVDTTALAGVRYDYRVIGHYESLFGRTCAKVEDVGSPGTPVSSPAPVTGAVEAHPDFASPTDCGSGMTVGLAWHHHLRDFLPTPDEMLEPADGNPPLRYILHRDDTSDPPGFVRLTRPFQGPDCAAAMQIQVPPIHVGGMPDPADPAMSVWKAPPFYRDTSVVVGKSYVYRVRGVDVFGRFSASADSVKVTVPDQVPPPPPLVTEARIFQLADPAVQRLPEYGALSAAAGGAASVLRLEWLWPTTYRRVHCDLEDFLVRIGARSRGLPELPVVIARIPGSAPDHLGTIVDFPATPLPGACSDGADNDGDGLVDFDGPGDADPDPECADADDDSEGSATAEAYEVLLPIPNAEPVSEDDPESGKVFTFEVGMQTVDGAMNASSVLRGWPVALRDITAPAVPPAPRASKPTTAPDPEGRSAVAIEWDTIVIEPHVTFLVYRVDLRAACDADPDCSDPDAADRKLLREFARGRPDIFTLITPGPVGPFPGGVASYVDRVPAPARTADEYLYSVRAVDPAGNRAALSAPSEWIVVPDSFPPAKPVIARATGDAVGNVTVEWPMGSDPDLDLYRLYSTDVEVYRASKRKMTPLIELDPNDPPEDVGFDAVTKRFSYVDTLARPENVRFYRLEAVDTSGNVSSLSEWAAARTADNVPPAAPTWRVAPRWSCNAEDEPVVSAGWRVSGAGIESRLLLRRILEDGGEGSWQAVTEWLEGSPRSYLDEDFDGPESEHDFKVEARDGSGNIASSGLRRLRDAPDCGLPRPRPFRRGDPNLSGGIDIADAVSLLNGLFGAGIGGGGVGGGAGGGLAGTAPFACEAAADVNLSGRVDVSDPIYLLRFLFLGGPAPPPPFPGCGTSVQEALPCAESICP